MAQQISLFYKIVDRLLPDYLYSYLDFPSQESYLLRWSSASIISSLPTTTKSFKGTLFLYCMNEWDKRKVRIRNAKSINIFKKSIVSKKNKKKNWLFCIYDPLGVKLLTRLRLQFSHIMNINLDMVLVTLSSLCVHTKLKLKLQNIFSCVVNFAVIKD